MHRIKELPWNWKTFYGDIHRSIAWDGQYEFLSPYFPWTWINLFDSRSLRP